jgi:acyl transferase domain-containing protein
VRRLFETTVSAQHPVVAGHRIHDRAVLPGLAYIDLLLQLACPAFGIGFDAVSLRRLSILQPLVVDTPGVRLRIVFTPIAQGWTIDVEGIDDRRYATAELILETVMLDGRIDVALMQERADRRIGMEAIYAASERRGLTHAGIIRAAGTVDVAADVCLIELHAEGSDADGLLCHPAIIDGAAMAAEALRDFDDQTLFLPLHYETFACSERIPRNCYAVIDRSSIVANDELVRLDIRFYAANGRQVAELRGMTSKRVRSGTLPAPVARVTDEADPRAVARAHASDATPVEATIRALLAPLLDVPVAVIDADAGFFAIGLQSSQMLDLLARIERAFDLRLSPTLLFEHGTLREVVDHVQRRLEVTSDVQTVPVAALTAEILTRRMSVGADQPLVHDHRFYGRPALMGVAHPCFALDAALDDLGQGALEAIVFAGGPLPLSPPDSIDIDLQLADGRFHVSQDGHVCCSGRVVPVDERPRLLDLQLALEGARKATDDERDAHYTRIRDISIGPALRVIEALYEIDSVTQLARVVLDESVQGPEALPILLLNACYLLIPAIATGDGKRPLVPLAIERIDAFDSAPRWVWMLHSIRTVRQGYAAFDATFYDEHGRPFAQVRNASVKEVTSPAQLSNFERAVKPARQANAADIAIVGLAGRYPGAPDLETFWTRLYEGADCIVDVPASRWDWRTYCAASPDQASPDRLNRSPGRWGGFLDDVDMFAPLFFQISPRDAALMDPQERLFLEQAWLAIEDAGHTRDSLAGPVRPAERLVGVYAAVMSQEYALFAAEASLGGQPLGLPTGIASVANRVSFHCDFRGPSIAVDTMCSGSLSAFALACDALRAGTVDAALAGGVNLSLHPNKYLMLSQGGFIASRGRCGSFGIGGDGYVPSEGVGVAVLKRLVDAERDGDAIYGVIKGIALNHGGRTSGYTVPNPRAQQDVVAQAWRQAALDPRSLDYIEAHGTGTALGDPIEIEGLARAFAGAGLPAGGCAIGSVKSNIGHCESAAGVAGLTKVLLQIKHRLLVPSLHAEVLNPNINFSGLPFAVQRGLSPWRARADQPRLAAVSSFGAGGANAHLIVQEHVSAPRPTADANHEWVFPLSARSVGELAARATKLASAIEQGHLDNVDTADIAWTLQIGREPMPYRLAVVERSLERLALALRAYVRGEPASAVHFGEVERGASALSSLPDSYLTGLAASQVQSGRSSECARRWVAGGAIDWTQLHDSARRRVHLPGYPFARERCWLDLPARDAGAARTGPHPLLHENTSTLRAQQYTSTFANPLPGSEDGRRIPALVALEMAIAAAVHASGEYGWSAVTIEAIRWSEEFDRVDAEGRGRPIHATVLPVLDGDGVTVEVTNGGQAKLDASLRLWAAQAESVSFDLPGIEAMAPRPLSDDPSVRGVWSDGQVTVARIERAAGSGTDAWLPPDLAATLVRLTGTLVVGTGRRAASLSRLVAYLPCPQSAWVRISRRAGVFDIDICDIDGRLCVQVSGLELAGDALDSADDVHVFIEHWRPQPLTGDGPASASPRPWLWFVDDADEADAVRTALAPLAPGIRVITVVNDDDATERARGPGRYGTRLDDPDAVRVTVAAVAADFGTLEGACYLAGGAGVLPAHIVPRALHVLHALQSAAQGLRRIVLCGRWNPDHPEERARFESWIGIQRSFHAVMPGAPLSCVFTELEPGIGVDAFVQRIWREARVSEPHCAMYINGVRHAPKVEALPLAPPNSDGKCLRQRGTYLITGGLGSIGRRLARYLRHTVDARLVLVGRSPLDPARSAIVDVLADGRPDTVAYICSDLTCADTLQSQLAELALGLGPIHGVFHLAGTTGVGTFSERSSDQHARVLQPKIDGTLALGQVLHGEPLDFACYFASAAGILGDFGACDYAAGNRFQLAHARMRAGGSGGRTLAVAWPLWEGDGMSLDGGGTRTDAYLAATGQRMLGVEEGFALLERLLQMDAGQPLVLAGDRQRIATLLPYNPEYLAAPADIPPPGDAQHRRDVEAELKSIAGEVLKLAPERIVSEAILADFGFDSITLQLYANRIAARWQIAVAPTVFFSHPTIAALAEHFVPMVRTAAPTPLVPPRPTAQAVAPQRRFASAPMQDSDEAIAIVGISGRFPGARTIDAMWQVLCDGIDAVAEIPGERFDWSAVFVADAGPTSGKTNCKWAGILPGVAEFDPLFFEIAPSEAALIDPRQRLLLQEAYRALEDAAFGEDAFARQRIGVFVGAEAGAYGGLEAERETITANHEAVLAARLSYFLDLHGPNLALNTACSSGLVALHMACTSLRQRECDAAVVGAVNLLLVPDAFVGMTRAGMLSPDGRCHAFDRRANGMVPGEAVVAVVLRRLGDAEADGDCIHAVVRGTGVNHDGRTNGLTAPNGAAQAELIRLVQARSRIRPDDIEYVVTHGTGTALGDPVEIEALTAAFGARETGAGQCALTSTKTNFGHTFAASGLVSLACLIEALRRAEIPPSLHCAEATPFVDWQKSPFFVNTAHRRWAGRNGVRTGAVSAFGMSGTNAHAVLQSYQPLERAAMARGPVLLALSAKTAEALAEQRRLLAEHLQAVRPALLDVSCTLLTGRRHYRCRQAWLVNDLDDALAQLARDAGTGAFSAVVSRDIPSNPLRTDAALAALQRCKATYGTSEADRDALRVLAACHVEGVPLPWQALFAGTAARRLSLPTYPFARDPYWISRRVVEPAPMPVVILAAAPVDVELDPGGSGTAAVELVERLLAEQLGVPLERIDPDAPLDEYGFDSIMAAALIARVRRCIPDAVESMFLEHSTLAAVRGYLRGCAIPPARHAPDAKNSMPSSMAVPAERQPEAREGVAIVGLAALLPGVKSIDDFWRCLLDGDVQTRPLPTRRRELLGIDEGSLSRDFGFHGGWLDGVEFFDHERFKLTRAEAIAMDPQLRKLIETVWQAVANAGYTMADFKRRDTAVFVATSGHSGYAGIGRPQRATRADDERPALYANRISNLFDLRGPSEIIDAGCASFLVAIGRALDALGEGRCEQAIVATGQLSLSPDAFLHPEKNVLYTAGETTGSFGRDSDGYVPSEVIGAIVLKRMPSARLDGDEMYGVLKGVGTFHGGKSPLKWYSPNVQGQKRAIEDALRRGGIDPATIDYVEAEANGSQLGDASEIAALQAVYGPRDEESPLRISSLKPVFGHAEVGSTFPALLKVLLSLREERIPGVVGLGELNENIRLQQGCRIANTTDPWPRRTDGRPRRAAVHSLSLGGVNAHLIVEEACLPSPSPMSSEASDAGPRLFLFSDRTLDQLRESVAKCVSALAARGVVDAEGVGAIADTLECGRVAEKQRLAVVATSLRQLYDRLYAWLKGEDNAEGVYCATGSGGGRDTDDEPTTLAAQAWMWVRGGRITRSTRAAKRVHLPAQTLARTLCWHEHLMLQVQSTEAPLAPLVLVPRWSPAAIPTVRTSGGGRHRILLCGWPDGQAAHFREDIPGVEIAQIALPEDSGLPERFTALSQWVFGRIRDALMAPPELGDLLQIVVPNGLDNVCLVAFAGLLRTARREHSRFRGQLVVLDHRLEPNAAGEQLADAASVPDEVFLQYIGGRRWVQRLEEARLDVRAQTGATSPFSSAAPVVMISGGGGALGMMIAERLLKNTPDLTVYLLGRSALDDARRAALSRLPAPAHQVHWLQCDVADRAQVQAAVETVVARSGRLNAIVHSAGTLHDGLIVNKDVLDINAVLAPKIAGLCHLDEATRHLDLDFVLAFSSVSAVFGNPGQAAYSLANAFLDAYAAYRNRLVQIGERQGRTLSVNWPLWRDGGMAPSPEAVDRLMHEHGLLPMPGEIGTDLAMRLLDCGESQVAVVYGHTERIKHELSARRRH